MILCVVVCIDLQYVGTLIYVGSQYAYDETIILPICGRTVMNPVNNWRAWLAMEILIMMYLHTHARKRTKGIHIGF